MSDDKPYDPQRPTRLFRRFVAIGDSATEGLDDPDPRGGFRGWADRLALQLAAASDEPVEYANLAIRGLMVNEIRSTQFDRALAMQPDLLSIIGGVNDIIGLRPDFDQLQTDFAAMFGEATAAGCTVITMTMPDPGAVNPIGAYVRERNARLNTIIHAEAERYGVEVLALEDFAVATDPRLWSDDRLHGNSLGHERVADGFAWLLNVPGSSDAWTRPLAETPEQVARRERLAGDLQWARQHFGPWLSRGLRGIAPGDGISPKRPEPVVVVAEEAPDGPEATPPAGEAPAEPAAEPTDLVLPEITPYLAVRDAQAALTWYATALDATVVGEPILNEDGTIGHADLTIGPARFFLAEAQPAINAPAPTRGGSPVTLHLQVADVDALADTLRSAGAHLDREPADTPCGRIAVLRDPFGHRWMLNRPQ